MAEYLLLMGDGRQIHDVGKIEVAWREGRWVPIANVVIMRHRVIRDAQSAQA